MYEIDSGAELKRVEVKHAYLGVQRMQKWTDLRLGRKLFS